MKRFIPVISILFFRYDWKVMETFSALETFFFGFWLLTFDVFRFSPTLAKMGDIITQKEWGWLMVIVGFIHLVVLGLSELQVENYHILRRWFTLVGVIFWGIVATLCFTSNINNVLTPLSSVLVFFLIVNSIRLRVGQVIESSKI